VFRIAFKVISYALSGCYTYCTFHSIRFQTLKRRIWNNVKMIDFTYDSKREGIHTRVVAALLKKSVANNLRRHAYTVFPFGDPDQ
jgi:hypothetical protein